MDEQRCAEIVEHSIREAFQEIGLEDKRLAPDTNKRRPVDALWPDRMKALETSTCSHCHRPVDPVKEDWSRLDVAEYNISGTCPECWDKMFGEFEAMEDKDAAEAFTSFVVDSHDETGPEFA